MAQRYLSYLKENTQGTSEIVFQEPTQMSDEAIQEMDEFLRKTGKIGEDEEIAITYDLE